MNQPWMYVCSPCWSPLPAPSPSHPSGSSQCTSPEHPVSCIEPGLAITTGTLNSSLLGMQNDTATLETISLFLDKIKHDIAILLLSIYWNGLKKCPHKTGPESNSSFIHNCQNLEATKMSFSWWTNELWYMQMVKYHSALKEMSYQTMKRHGVTLNAYYSV